MVDAAIHVDLPRLIALQAFAKQSELTQRKKIRMAQNGAFLSPLRGRGMDFAETRPYQAGDDIRFMDSRVLARTGHAHTKLFCVERERPVWIVLDQSLSLRFGTRKCFKSVAAAELAASFAWTAVQHGDRVGGIIFHDEVVKIIKPQSRQQGILRLFQQIVTVNQAIPTTNITTQLELVCDQLRRLCRPGAMIYIISDFSNITNKTEKYLCQLAQHNEVKACFLYDNLEAEPPPPGIYQVSNGIQTLLLNTYSTEVCNHYRQQFLAHIAKLRALFQQYRIQFIAMPTAM